jgi:8-oxo-dGTP pyrophosphatase MutT (NUDIX family)
MARRPPRSGGPIVEPIAAATVVLVRSVEDGIEVLLTERPATMSFAAGATVFPGGRVDPADGDPRLADRSTRTAADSIAALGEAADGATVPRGEVADGATVARGEATALALHHAAIRELFEEAGVLLAAPARNGDAPRAADVEAARRALLDGSQSLLDVAERLDVRLDTAALVPIARWVTPAAYARRFDARFFAAELPVGGTVATETTEVSSHRWVRPIDALEAMADGQLSLWIPTSATLQRLARATSFADVRVDLAARPAAPIRIERLAPDRISIACSTAGGAPGAVVTTTVVGMDHLTVVDPGDPSPEALTATLAAAEELGGTIAAILLTSPEPECAAGADELSERTGAPVYAPPGTRRRVPYVVEELGPGEPVPLGAAGLRMPGEGSAGNVRTDTPR